MTFFHFYVRKRKVIIPTVAQTEAGFFIDAEPVQVIQIRDLGLLKQVLSDAFAQGNPSIPTPDPAGQPGSVILDAVGVKRWEAFEKESVLYTVHTGDGAIIMQVTGRGKDGMWIHEKSSDRFFALETPVSEIVEAVVTDLLNTPELLEPEPSLPMLLPGPSENKSD